MVLIFLQILCMFLLFLDCSFGTYAGNHCKLNDNLEYLNTKSLSELKFPKDLDIILPISCSDYCIPDIPDTNINQKIGKEVDICPPLVLSMDMLSESCLVNIEIEN